jgi:biotin-dependent carboxylase-like uncharacterized protein
MIVGSSGRRNQPGAIGTVEIAKSGIAMIQHLGWRGRLRDGMSWKGPADPLAARVANAIVGNEPNAGTIEVVALPLQMVPSTEILVCVTGATANVTADGATVPQWAPVRISANTTFRLDTIRLGLRVYVAIRGGVSAPHPDEHQALDSAIPADGWLMIGDRLSVGPEPDLRPMAGALPSALIPEYGSPWRLDVTHGPDLNTLPGALKLLCDSDYRVRPESNKVGIRLVGPAIRSSSRRRELLSRGVAVGAVEILPNGEPLILGPSHSVTAGYPVVAVVVRPHTNRLGQLRPGDIVRFRLTDLHSAVTSARARSEALLEHIGSMNA